MKLKTSFTTFLNISDLNLVKKVLKIDGDIKNIGFYAVLVKLRDSEEKVWVTGHVFHNESEKYPDTPYLIISRTYDNKYYKIGKTKKEFQEMRYQNALKCLECDTVLYSMDRHDCLSCGCPNDAMVDGGQESYTRYGAGDMSKVKPVVLDILTGELKKERKNGRKDLR